MEKIKTRMLVGGLAMAIAGGASAVPMIPKNWTKTFTITATANNKPDDFQEPVPEGTLWLYAPKDFELTPGNPKNQTTSLTLSDAGPTLPPTNSDGHPVEYTLEKIVIEGLSHSLAVFAETGDGVDLLTDIRGTIAEIGGGVTNYFPFDGVGLCSGFDAFYTVANLSTGAWTGPCTGSPYPITPLMINKVVTDATQYELLFWNETPQRNDQPDARIDGLTVKFIGTCTNNCEPAQNPAPVTLALLSLGLAALGSVRRRTKG